MTSEVKTDMPRKTKFTLIVILVAGISFLHYFTEQSRHHYHVFYGELYFLPIVLAGLWFGLRGALATSLGITACYVPFAYWHWQGFSPDDLDRILSVALYNSLAAFIGVLKDRETILHERQLKTESLAAMGKSLAAVAHDMKTPIIAIGGFSRSVLKRLKEGDPALEKLAIVIKETGRLENMIKDMLDFSRPLALHLTHEDLNEIVQNSLVLVAEMAEKKNVTIQTLLSKDISAVPCDVLRMKQVVVNLALNAVHASAEGGTVTVRTSIVGENIIIDVADCGCGIPYEQRNMIFDPFFTTKKEGTGLGLAIVKKIVEAHDGSLKILDNAPKGIVFRVILPRQ